MADYEFSFKLKGEISVQLAKHLGVDKPADKSETAEKSKLITRMQLKHRDDRGHETEVLEWHGHKELYETPLDIIVRSIELAATRDAAYQLGGDIVYALIFHSEDHPNRSRFMFKIPGGQELSHVTSAALARRGGDEDKGSSFPERIMPDILRYVSEKEAQLDKRSAHLWEMMMKSNQHLSLVVQEYTDREGKLREIELNADDHAYERSKKRREDERAEKQSEELWKLIKEHGPKALPVVLGALQRFSRGPGVEHEPGFIDWWQDYQRAEEEKERAERSSGAKPKKNGAPNGQDGQDEAPAGGSSAAQAGPEPEVVDAEIVTEAGSRGSSGEGPKGKDIGMLKLRVAFDTARFVMLARGRGKLDAARQALSEPQRKLFDEVVEACSAEDTESDAAVERIASLALAFGGAMQADPASALAAYAALDKMCQLAMKELSKLLEVYQDRLRS